MWKIIRENFLSAAGGEKKAVRVFCAIMKGVKWSFFPCGDRNVTTVVL